jgi:hypothetical protein
MLLVLIKCSDLDLNPTSQVSTNTFFSNDSELEIAINDLYKKFLFKVDRNEWTDDYCLRGQPTNDITAGSDRQTASFIRQKFAVRENVIDVQESSVLIKDDKGRRWRLPLGDEAFTPLTDAAALRIDREVATEHDLFNCYGTFYELPAENADGFAKIRWLPMISGFTTMPVIAAC